MATGKFLIIFKIFDDYNILLMSAIALTEYVLRILIITKYFWGCS